MPVEDGTKPASPAGEVGEPVTKKNVLDEDDIDLSLNQVMVLLVEKIDSLQATLEFYRLSSRCDGDSTKGREQIRHLVHEIDYRQDRLEEIKALILAAEGGVEH